MIVVWALVLFLQIEAGKRYGYTSEVLAHYETAGQCLEAREKLLAILDTVSNANKEAICLETLR